MARPLDASPALLLGIVLGCSGPAPAPPDSDCTLLAATARRARACDPALAAIADELESADAEQCRQAARVVLDRVPLPSERIRSVFDPAPPIDAEPLSADEREALRTLTFPGTVVITPDVPHRPGVAATRASIGGSELALDDAGRASLAVTPGEHTVRLGHAGRTETYCLRVRACTTLALTAHGAQLARHPDVRAGPCA